MTTPAQESSTSTARGALTRQITFGTIRKSLTDAALLVSSELTCS
jgi:homoserine kinase